MPSFSLGVMVGPIQKEFGWSRAAISLGLMVPSVSAVLLGPVIGLAVDRWGPRRIALIGILAAPGAIALLGAAGPSIWSWWMLWSLVAIAAMFVKPMVWTAGVSSLFAAGRGLALAVTLCGLAASSSVTPILTNYLVEHFGWRVGYFGLAAFWGCLALPLVILFFRSLADQKPPPTTARARDRATDGSARREGLASLRFLRLATAGATMVLALVLLTLNLVPILVSGGHSAATAAGVAGCLGVATVVGRLASGQLLDRMNGNIVGAASTVVPAIVALMLLSAPSSVPVAVAATLILGLSMGAETDTLAYLVTRHFGLRSFGVMFGTIGGLMALATGLGPLIGNLVYDIAGSYDPALWLVVPMAVVSALLFLSLGRYPDLDEDVPQPHGEAA